MAYRFVKASSNKIEFAIAPFVGYTFGAQTVAMFVEINSVTDHYVTATTDSAGSTSRWFCYPRNTGAVRTFVGGIGGADSSQTPNSTSTWYLIVMTRPGGSTLPRYHVHDGTSWVHANAPSGTMGDTPAFGSTDRLFVGSDGFSGYGNFDIVCVGIKKASSTDLQVETLNRTGFASWTAFGFDWLIGFDSSFVSAGKLQDQASPGTGDELTRSGTSLVSDPVGWSFAIATAPVANFTGTPLSGAASLSVAFTDSSTNTPTSWAWTFGDGSTSTSQSPTHSYTTSGIYTVTLVATNGAGSDTKTRTAYVTVTETIVYVSGGGIAVY